MHFAAQKVCVFFLFGFGEKGGKRNRPSLAGCADTVNMARARLGIGAELALLSHCDAMLSMDSANMHLASPCRTAGCHRMGRNPPCTGFYGAGRESGRRHSARHGLPPMLHLRQPALPHRRLSLPDADSSRLYQFKITGYCASSAANSIR